MATRSSKPEGARPSALEGSTPSSLRISDEAIHARVRALPSVDKLATVVARAELEARRAELLAGARDNVDLAARL